MSTPTPPPPDDPITRQRKIDLWAESDAPRRHRDKADTVSLKGEWGKTLAGITPKLGSGFLYCLHGPNGTGKTQLAVCLMVTQIDTRIKSAVFISAMQFFIEIKGSYRKDSSESEDEILSRYARPSLLIIDEVEKRGESDWANNLLFHLINRRHNAQKDTVLMSNLTSAELSSHLGPALVTRMNQTGGMVHCNWPSMK